MPVNAIGTGKLQAEIGFYSSQFLWAGSAAELAQSILFEMNVSWDTVNGSHETRNLKVPSSYLQHVIPNARDVDNSINYYLSNSGLESPLVTPEFAFEGNVTNISVSVCNLKEQVSISIRKINLTVSLNEK